MASQARQQLPARAGGDVRGAGAAPDASAQARFGNSFLAEQLAARTGGVTADGPSANTDAGPAVDGPAPAPDAGAKQAAGGGAGSGSGPLKVNNPLPVRKGEQKRTVCGVQIIGTDVSPSALDACETFVRLTVGNRKDIQDRLAKANVALVILPRDKKMTEVSQFSGLKGTKTFDGRMWDDVRGSGGMKVAGGIWAIAVPEENLVEAEGATDKYGSGYSVGLHEFAHTVHAKGVTDDERKQIAALYAARKKANGPWTESYGASNEKEYFAQSTNCFLGENAGVGQNGAAWLRDNDKPMYDLLVSIYGPPPQQTQLSAAPSEKGDFVVPDGDAAHA
jgi:hypothetical protein